jgi:hypothetical protein
MKTFLMESAPFFSTRGYTRGGDYIFGKKLGNQDVYVLSFCLKQFWIAISAKNEICLTRKVLCRRFCAKLAIFGSIWAIFQ